MSTTHPSSFPPACPCGGHLVHDVVDTCEHRSHAVWYCTSCEREVDISGSRTQPPVAPPSLDDEVYAIDDEAYWHDHKE